MLPVFGASLITGLLLSTGVSATPLKAVRQSESLSPVLARDDFVDICGLDVSWEKHAESLFSATVAAAAGSLVADAHVSVDCIECYTTGKALVSGVKIVQNAGLLGDIVSLVEDVEDLVEAIGVNIRIDLGGITAHIVADIDFTAGASYSLAIFTSDLIDAFALDDTVKVSLMLYLDLIFSLTADIDVTAGVDISLPVGAYVEVNALTGLVVDVNLEGVSASGTGVSVRSGGATLDLALRARVEIGTEIELLGEKVTFELAAFVDLTDYTAVLVKTVDCFVELVEYFSVDLGVEAKLVADLNFLEFEVAVSLVVPQFTAALPTICLLSSAPTSTGIKGNPGVQSSPTASVTASASIGSGAGSPSVTSTPGAASGSASGSGAGASSVTSTPGGVFEQASSSSGPSTTPAPLSMSRIPSGRFGNSSITAPAGMTTSTVYSIVTSTITSCAQTVVHCPASAKSTTVVTSTVFAYTTVCPVSAELKATPTASSAPSIAPVTPSNTVTFVAVPTTATSVTSIAAGPVPTQTAPLTTSIPFPFTNSSSPAAASVAPQTGVPSPVAVTSVAVVQPVPAVASTAVVASTSPTGPSKSQFTGAASRGSVSLVFGAVLALGAAALAL